MFFTGKLTASGNVGDTTGAFAYNGNYVIKNCFADYKHNTNNGFFVAFSSNFFR